MSEFKSIKNNIRVVGNTDNKPLFIAKDICQILGIKNVSDVTSKLSEKNKSIVKCDTLGGSQDLIAIDIIGLKYILSRTRSSKISEIINELNLDLNVIYSFDENHYGKILEESFEFCNIRKQFMVGKYRVDFYFIDYKLIVECDENNHENRNKEYEQERENYIKKELNCSFIRFNPNIKNFNIGSIISKIFKHITDFNQFTQPEKTKFKFKCKFPSKPCIYVAVDENSKNKIGKITGENNLEIFGLKIKLILYTEHCALFEQIIKVKFQDRLELPSHEWIIEDTDILVKSIKELDRIIGFNSIEETELWKYNLEDPPDEYKNIPDKEDPWKETIKEKVTGNEGKLCTMMLADRLHQILPGYLCNSDVIKKNTNAPKGQKWCNGFHQEYRETREFSKAARGLVKICDMCHSMETLAYQKIESKELTPDQIRKNPTLIAVEKDEKVCSMCKEVKNKLDFDSNRRKCQKCRSEKVVETLDKFRDNIEEEIKKLKETDEEKREFKISKLYTKDQLQVIIKHLKLGRKSSAIKEELIAKVLEYFATQNN